MEPIYRDSPLLILSHRESPVDCVWSTALGKILPSPWIEMVRMESCTANTRLAGHVEKWGSTWERKRRRQQSSFYSLVHRSHIVLRSCLSFLSLFSINLFDFFIFQYLLANCRSRLLSVFVLDSRPCYSTTRRYLCIWFYISSSPKQVVLFFDLDTEMLVPEE